MKESRPHQKLQIKSICIHICNKKSVLKKSARTTFFSMTVAKANHPQILIQTISRCLFPHERTSSSSAKTSTTAKYNVCYTLPQHRNLLYAMDYLKKNIYIFCLQMLRPTQFHSKSQQKQQQLDTVIKVLFVECSLNWQCGWCGANNVKFTMFIKPNTQTFTHTLCCISLSSSDIGYERQFSGQLVFMNNTRQRTGWWV